MCGIVGAVAERDVVPILIEGLRRLEYRGYDSAGVAVIDEEGVLQRLRLPGKVDGLADALKGQELAGYTGIAHTRWATHGRPSGNNAHPHVCRNTVAVVHNGIIENHEALRRSQLARDHLFTSETDTEVIVHQVHDYLHEGCDLLEAVRSTASDLEGAFALGVVTDREPDRLVAARQGSPLVIGVGIGEHFIASDVAALLPVTRRFIFLEEGDIADITRERVVIYDAEGNKVTRPVRDSELSADSVERGEFRHYMLKEIHEQPRAIADTLEGRISAGRLLEASLGHEAGAVLDQVRRITIVACGTSYHAGMVARYWFEGIAGVPCSVEVASEFRYREPIPEDGNLLVLMSQSGETADTLAALREARRTGFADYTLAICNVPESSLVRETDLVLMTRAGPEIGVASTKAFTTQLVSLLLLVIAVGRRHRLAHSGQEESIVAALKQLPGQVERAVELNSQIEVMAGHFAEKRHALFLGRGPHFPVAMEGALKLKEISYIHAEAYPAGELKHGPLALVDSEMPVITVAPNDSLLEKLKSNLQEVRARGGELFVFAGKGIHMDNGDHVLELDAVDAVTSPILYTVPLQLLAYHVAVLKGTDVDQPRNLAKSVTVE
ncbi:glutamine--fructose-6-phosphate transaminase (isomerizing) [Thiohalomonas denitrificans]|uniref:Glutamine--fructose-6-phosphate aminotransferase [isomerizing] n=1 Tax=Thiohalomonas denitrificans TaxID=415747 RepID=A0A1G5QRQ4_9GAMM|nr:glutamine--fructose-6-phosphate transaminase (isomerizing) [Thiohalomonas denitrificans]SCZ64432.1 glucosamine--fructose-6-phosphate aminotransferase (isomerizing) [Thiohalomonas denitrificans]